jgi:hypothetical protein
MDDGFIWALIPISAIVGGITYAIVKATSMARVRELEVRERIAMIERGLIPPPEANPRGFEKAMAAVDRADRARWDDDESDFLSDAGSRSHLRRAPERHRSAGITLIGVGFGIMLMIGLAGDEPERGIGVGGFLVLLGVAFFINSMFERRDRARWRAERRLEQATPPPPPYSAGIDSPPRS